MAILRKNNKSRFTVVCEEATRDDNLSLKAFGLLVKLLSFPDNWEFSENGLIATFKKDGQASIRSGLKELEDNGYLVRTRTRDGLGKMSKVEWVVCENPHLENPSVDNPSLENPHLENRPQSNTYRIQDLKNKKESIEKESKTAYIDDEFCFLDGKLTDLKTGESVKYSPRPSEASADAGEANHTTQAQTPSRTAPESKQTRFTPPTIDECRAYCSEKGYEWDPEAFIDFYDSKGWLVGKSKMKDWKASMRNWNRGESRRFASKPSMSQQASTFKAAPKGKYDDLPF